MTFTGKFVNGVFVPDKSYKGVYDAYKQRLSETGMNITLEINTSSPATRSQINLFNMVVRKAAEASGHTFREILGMLEQFRPVSLTDNCFQSLANQDMTRHDMMHFIEDSLNYLNSHLDLNLTVGEVSA